MEDCWAPESTHAPSNISDLRALVDTLTAIIFTFLTSSFEARVLTRLSKIETSSGSGVTPTLLSNWYKRCSSTTCTELTVFFFQSYSSFLAAARAKFRILGQFLAIWDGSSQLKQPEIAKGSLLFEPVTPILETTLFLNIPCTTYLLFAIAGSELGGRNKSSKPHLRLLVELKPSL